MTSAIFNQLIYLFLVALALIGIGTITEQRARPTSGYMFIGGVLVAGGWVIMMLLLSSLVLLGLGWVGTL